ncbi:MAG: alginate export family protein [Planctomycetota bacterium]
MHLVKLHALLVLLAAGLLLLPANSLLADDPPAADAGSGVLDATPAPTPTPTPAPTPADNGMDIWSHFRPHVEIRLKPEWATNNNANTHGDMNVFLRTRLGLTWTADDDISATVILQDVHKFEFTSSGGGTVGGGGTTTLGLNTDLYVGYLLWNITDEVMFQAGRQEFSYDSQRLVGALDWVDAGRQFDAFRLRIGNAKHDAKEFSLDLFWTPLRFVGSPNPASRFAKHSRQFMGAHAQLPMEDHKLSTYLYYLNNAGGTTPDHIFTLGAFFASTAKEGLLYDAEFAIQVSKTNGVDSPGFAWAGHGNVGFASGGMKLMGEVNMATGDIGGATLESFTNLFPTNHNKYGYIDREDWSNTINFAVRFFYNLDMGEDTKPISFELSAWVFIPMRYSNANDDVSPGGSFAVGARGWKAFEIDLLVGHQFTDVLKASFGASIWVPGAALRVAGIKSTDLYLYALIGLKY